MRGQNGRVELRRFLFCGTSTTTNNALAGTDGYASGEWGMAREPPSQSGEGGLL